MLIFSGSLLIIVNGFTQQCHVKYFQSNYHHVGTNGYPSLTLLPDNSLIISSLFNSTGTNLVKLSSQGDTIWNKSYINSSLTGANRLTKTLYDANGNLFSVLNQKYLTEMDTAGNVLVTQSLNGLDNYGFRDAGIFPGGDKLIFFERQNGYNYGSVLIRVDKNLNSVKWSVLVGGWGPDFSNIVIDGNMIVIAGGSIDDPNTGTGNLSFVVKINGDNGGIINAVSYRDPMSSSRAISLYKSANGYIIMGYASKFENTNNGTSYYIRLDNDLHIQASKQLAEIPNANTGLYYFLPQNDGSFYGTYGQNFNLTLFKVNSGDSILWSRRQPDNFSFPGDLKQNDDGLFVSGVQNWNNVVTGGAETNFFLSKSDFNGNLAGCPSQDVNEIKTADYSFTEASLSMTSTAFPVTLTSDNTMISPYPLDFSLFCTGVSACTSLLLMGDTSICNSRNFSFTGRKNQNCTNSIQWKLFPEQGYILESKNDSMISVRFSHSGNYLLSGSLSSCPEAKDSMVLHVNLIPAFSLGPDTTICHGTVTLHAGSQFKSYLWQDGSSDSVFNTSDTGSYSVQVTDYCLNTFQDTIHIARTQLSLDLPSDTVKCVNDTLKIQTASGYTNYQWSPLYGLSTGNGGKKAFIYVKTDTSYTVSAEKGPGCIVLDTIHVRQKTQPMANLGPDTVLCDGTTKLLEAVNVNASYLWQDGSKNPDFLVDRPGVYFITINLDGCRAYDTIGIKYQSQPEITIENEASLCAGQELILKPDIQNAKDYKWQNGNSTSAYTVRDSGLYIISAENICGITTDSIRVRTALCSINMPSAFTPNHDGINDIFRVRYPFQVSSFRLEVFNRWGQKVFETRDINNGWDGTTGGDNSPSGTYVWFIIAKHTDGREENMHGAVILVR